MINAPQADCRERLFKVFQNPPVEARPFVRWWGKHAYDARDILREGKNYLEVEITTTLLNYVKSLTDNRTAQRWTSNTDPAPTGLVGPVLLMEE